MVLNDGGIVNVGFPDAATDAAITGCPVVGRKDLVKEARDIAGRKSPIPFAKEALA